MEERLQRAEIKKREGCSETRRVQLSRQRLVIGEGQVFRPLKVVMESRKSLNINGDNMHFAQAKNLDHSGAVLLPRGLSVWK